MPLYVNRELQESTYQSISPHWFWVLTGTVSQITHLMNRVTIVQKIRDIISEFNEYKKSEKYLPNISHCNYFNCCSIKGNFQEKGFWRLWTLEFDIFGCDLPGNLDEVSEYGRSRKCQNRITFTFFSLWHISTHSSCRTVDSILLLLYCEIIARFWNLKNVTRWQI